MTHEEISLQTKQQLANALKEAMKKKPFSKITVSELVGACGMNRKTFYYHFQDIYDLLVWMFEQEAIGIVKNFDLIVDYDEALNFIMDYIEENEGILNSVDSIGRDALQTFFYQDFEAISRSMIESAENKLGKKLPDGYRDWVCRFYTEGLSGMMIDWMRNRGRKSRDEVIEYTTNMVRDSLIGILNADPEKY